MRDTFSNNLREECYPELTIHCSYNAYFKKTETIYTYNNWLFMRQNITSHKKIRERGNSQSTAGTLVQINSNGPSLEPLLLPLRMWTISYPGRGYMTTTPLPSPPNLGCILMESSLSIV